MTGSLYEQNGKYYMSISFKNERGEWKQKQVATGLDVKDSTRKAEKMLKEYLSKHGDWMQRNFVYWLSTSVAGK